MAMAVIRCKMCGGDLVLTPDSSVAECEYCGTVQTVPTVDNEKKLSLFNRAHRLRRLCEFDKAAGVYEQIVAEFPEEAEAYWGLVLCDYGIEYVDDPADGKKIPTCHRSSYASVMENKDYSLALEYADASARKLYRQEAKQIEELRKGILTVSGKEAPYDIFICYKETDEEGNRTLDSVLAQDIYNALTEKGLRVFFSRVSLEDKLGQEYEPYIFAALNSARIMLVVGTDYERFQAVWVKNEWSRFLKLMEVDKNRYLIPCFRDIDAYDMPTEFARFQAQNLGKVGAIQDLLRGIDKLLPKKKQVTVIQERVLVSENPNTAPLLRRAVLFLEDRDWDSADKYCEKVLDMEPENGDAYFGKLMAEYHISREEELERIEPACLDSANYQKALRFGDEALLEKLEGIRKDTVYHMAKKLAARKDGREKANLREAIAQLQTIPGWRDSVQQIEIYRSTVREMEAREEAEEVEQQRKAQLARQQRKERQQQEQKKAAEFGHKLKIILPVVCAMVILAILVNTVVVPMLTGKKEETLPVSMQTEIPEAEEAEEPVSPEYAAAEELYQQGRIAEAAIAFGKLGDYSDARERSFALWDKVAVRNTVAVGSFHTLALKNDGTVYVAGENVSNWNTMTQKAERIDEEYSQCDVADWSDIVAVSAYGVNSVGLKADGTVVIAGRIEQIGLKEEIDGWQDIVSISVRGNNVLMGLKMDGTVVTASKYVDVPDISGWSDIIAVEAGGHLVGLKSDGTVVAAGDNQRGRCDVESWTDIIKISNGGNYTVGLRADNTVVATGQNEYGQCNVQNWADIVDVTAKGHYSTIGVKSDGTTVMAGRSLGWYNTQKWTDIVTVAASENHAVGLKSDGTLVSTGSNQFGQGDVSDWAGIKLPVSSKAAESFAYGETEDFPAYMGLTVQSFAGQAGAYVVDVDKGGVAEFAGIQPKDIIIALDGHSIEDVTALTRALRSYRAGDNANVKLIRDGKQLSVEIILDSQP